MSRFAMNPDVVLREEDDDGALLFNPDTSQVRVLNASALCIWKLCDGTRGIDDLVTALSDEFADIPAAEVGGQVQAFVDEMVAQGFLGTVETAPEATRR